MTDSQDESGTMPLTEWLENQKARAEERIEDDSVGERETWRWEGERQLIHSIQRYLEMGVLELE
jgi:hypothetical protein